MDWRERGGGRRGGREGGRSGRRANPCLANRAKPNCFWLVSTFLCVGCVVCGVSLCWCVGVCCVSCVRGVLCVGVLACVVWCVVWAVCVWAVCLGGVCAACVSVCLGAGQFFTSSTSGPRQECGSFGGQLSACEGRFLSRFSSILRWTFPSWHTQKKQWIDEAHMLCKAFMFTYLLLEQEIYIFENHQTNIKNDNIDCTPCFVAFATSTLENKCCGVVCVWDSSTGSRMRFPCAMRSALSVSLSKTASGGKALRMCFGRVPF